MAVELGWLLLKQIDELDRKIDGLDRELRERARENEEMARLMTIPGIGPITALALEAFAPPMESFRRARLLGPAPPRAAAAYDRACSILNSEPIRARMPDQRKRLPRR